MDSRRSIIDRLGLGLFAPRFRLGFLPLLAAAAPLAQGLASGLGGALGGSDGPAAPINNTFTPTANFAAVSFGAKHLGDTAVKEAPAVIAAENQSWTKYLPWVVGGVIALFALLIGLRRRK